MSFQKNQKRLRPQLIFVIFLMCALLSFSDEILVEIGVTKKSIEEYFLMVLVEGFLCYLLICTLAMYQKIEKANATAEYEMAFLSQQSMQSPPPQYFNLQPCPNLISQGIAQHQNLQPVPSTTPQDQLPADDQPPAYHLIPHSVTISNV